MKRGHVVSALALLLAAAGCTKDPTASLRGTPARLQLSTKVLTVDVGDSVAVTATAVDEQGNSLPEIPTASSETPGVVAVVSASGAPLSQARFFVKGLAFGEGTVTVTAGSVTETVRVLAYPASVQFSGQPDSLLSGASVVLTATPLGADNQPITGVTPITWESDDEDVVVIADPTGESVTISGFTPGVATLTVTMPGGLEAPVPVRVVAGAFGGTFSGSSEPAGVAVVNRAVGGPPFDEDTEITLGGVPVFVAGTPTADAISFVVPPVAATGERELLLINVGPDQLAFRGPFDITSTNVEDAHEPANDDPTTAPVIDSDDDVLYMILHGNCTDPGSFYGEPDNDPSAECDDWVTVTNTSGEEATITIEVDWNEPGNADPDVWVHEEADTSPYSEFDGSFAGHPEVVELPIAAGETFKLRLNLYEDAGVPAVLLRIKVTGLP